MVRPSKLKDKFKTNFKYEVKVKALDLFHIQGMDQNQVGEELEVSQPTVHRILKEARREASKLYIKKYGAKK